MFSQDYRMKLRLFMLKYVFFFSKWSDHKIEKKKSQLLNYIKIIMTKGAAQNSSLILNWKTQVITKLLKDDTLTLSHKNSPKFSNSCSSDVLKS